MYYKLLLKKEEGEKQNRQSINQEIQNVYNPSIVLNVIYALMIKVLHTN